MGRNALFAGGHQEQGGKPLGQRDFGALKNRLNRHRELLTAFGTLIQARTVRLASSFVILA